MQLAAELRRKATLLANEMLPLYQQLEAQVPPSITRKTEAELTAMRASLVERVDACADVLTEYQRLGQAPPPAFRSWPASQLRERHANMTTNAEILREIVKLDAQLGRTKMDWELPTWSVERLSEHAEMLTQKVTELALHKEKQELLGKVEAALWLRKQDPPMALHMMRADQLRDLLSKLSDTAEKSSSSAPAATKKASAAGEKRKAEKAPTARAKSGGSKGTKA